MTEKHNYINLLLNNELMRVVVSARLDSLCKMVNLDLNGYLPLPDEEGATGSLDNKGAIFVPGGLIIEDSDKNLIYAPKKAKTLSKNKFVFGIQNAMLHDNATLIYKNKIYYGVNLQNGFFIEKASKILTVKKSFAVSKKMPIKFSSEDITKYFSPPFIKTPYGSRNKLSSCLAVCLSEYEMYFIECADSLKIRDSEHKLIWKNLTNSLHPIYTKNKEILSMPHIVVCHTSRYYEHNYVGLVRILGFGGFGDFALVTFEKSSKKLMFELNKNSEKLSEQFFIELLGKKIYPVLRVYFYGGKSFKTYVIDLKKDLNVDYLNIIKNASKKYKNK